MNKLRRQPLSRRGMMRREFPFALGAVLVLALGVIAWRGKWFSRGPGVQIPKPLANPPNMEQLGADLANVVDTIVLTLGGISDDTTAYASLPAIEDATRLIISFKLDRLPDSYRAKMMPDVKPMVSRLVGILKKLYKLPGIQAIIEPSISPFLSRLQAFANVPAD
jgi:hypothetical protein